uniref:LRRCT domain-containing protein n=1 Tax=Aquila chrysaetos chrysaetos TaxID=223781 RepID=A0A663EX37_AQUCH
MVINPGAGASPRQVPREVCYLLLLAGLSLNISDSCPSMCKCAPEEIIHCNRAGLRALPGEIAASTVSLNLSNNYLRILTTNTFRNLTFLHSLWLDGNNLTFLSPGTFHSLSKLRELHLSRNSRLTYLHANTFRGLLNLISLDLSHSFRNLSSLMRLSLEGNHIELLRLGMLNLGHNFIADLPNQLFDGLIQLKTMHLEANRITAVDCTFRHLLNLRNLYLNNNQISSISDSAFSYLNKLHFLHLSKNNLSSLPIRLLAELPKLKYVFLSHNPWKCNCKMLWFWRWTATQRGAIKGLHCAFLGPHNMTALDVPHPGDLMDCTVPPEPASEDKCRVASTSVASGPPTLPSKVIPLALVCHVWYFARGWDSSVATF